MGNQPVKMAMSKIRQNYHEDCEALINKQINMEFYASYVYLSMSSFFNRDDQALHGFADHFKKESNDERAHGMKLMGTRPRGAVALSSRTSPSRPRWTGAARWKPWRPRSSLRRRSTRACSTSTRWLGTRATVTCATPRVRVPDRAGGGHQGRRRPDHQDEEGWRRTRTSHHLQGDGILIFKNIQQKPQLAAIRLTDSI